MCVLVFVCGVFGIVVCLCLWLFKLLRCCLLLVNSVVACGSCIHTCPVYLFGCDWIASLFRDGGFVYC